MSTIPVTPERKKITTPALQHKKKQGLLITCLTAYDYATAVP